MQNHIHGVLKEFADRLEKLPDSKYPKTQEQIVANCLSSAMSYFTDQMAEEDIPPFNKAFVVKTASDSLVAVAHFASAMGHMPLDIATISSVLDYLVKLDREVLIEMLNTLSFLRRSELERKITGFGEALEMYSQNGTISGSGE